MIKVEITPYYLKVIDGRTTYYFSTETGKFDGTSYQVADQSMAEDKDWNETRNFLLKGYENLPPDEKVAVWERCFNTFAQEVKQRYEVTT